MAGTTTLVKEQTLKEKLSELFIYGESMVPALGVLLIL